LSVVQKRTNYIQHPKSPHSMHQLCIPKMSANIKKETIFKTFCKVDWGYIKKITEIPLKNNPEYKRVFIELKWNMNKEKTREIYDRLDQQKPICLVYQMPFYWKIVAQR